jgi:hypothetical protein
MRKLAMVVSLAVMLVPLVAAAAFAADQLIYCKAAPCYGSGNNDRSTSGPTTRLSTR